MYSKMEYMHCAMCPYFMEYEPLLLIFRSIWLFLYSVSMKDRTFSATSRQTSI